MKIQVLDENGEQQTKSDQKDNEPTEEEKVVDASNVSQGSSTSSKEVPIDMKSLQTKFKGFDKEEYREIALDNQEFFPYGYYSYVKDIKQSMWLKNKI